MLTAAAAVQGASRDMTYQLASKPHDVPNAMRVFNQAAAGAYAVGAVLNSPVLGNAAVAASSGMLARAMEAAASMALLGLTAAAGAVEALESSGQLGSPAAATLRTRLPFLVGLLLRGLSEAPFSEHSPGGRALAELRRTKLTPSCLHDMAILAIQAMTPLLGQSAGACVCVGRHRSPASLRSWGLPGSAGL